MAERVLQYTATIPAGTPAATPHTVALALDHWDIEAIDLEVPAGPAGNLGFVLANNGMPWIPRDPGQWIVWDDHAARFPATDYPSGGGWQVIGYNTGAYPHAVIVRFHVDAPASAAAAEVPFVLTFVERDIPGRAPVVL